MVANLTLQPATPGENDVVLGGTSAFVASDDTDAEVAAKRVQFRVADLRSRILNAPVTSAVNGLSLPTGSDVKLIQLTSGGAALIDVPSGGQGGGGDITAVTAGSGLTGGGTTGAVTLAVGNLPTSQITSGRFAVARLGTGAASGSTFLRGDRTWATPPAGGADGVVSGITHVYDNGDITTTLTRTIGVPLSDSDHVPHWFDSPGVPSALLGQFGDWYIDISPTDSTYVAQVYNKTGASTWTLGFGIPVPGGGGGGGGGAGSESFPLGTGSVQTGGTFNDSDILTLGALAQIPMGGINSFTTISVRFGALPTTKDDDIGVRASARGSSSDEVNFWRSGTALAWSATFTPATGTNFVYVINGSTGGGGMGSGDITAVIAGTGLDGGATTGDAVLNVTDPYSAAEKSKLLGIEAGAEVNIGEEFTNTEKIKLIGIEDSADQNLTTEEFQDAVGAMAGNNLAYDDVNGMLSATGGGGASFEIRNNGSAVSSSFDFVNFAANVTASVSGSGVNIVGTGGGAGGDGIPTRQQLGSATTAAAATALSLSTPIVASNLYMLTAKGDDTQTLLEHVFFGWELLALTAVTTVPTAVNNSYTAMAAREDVTISSSGVTVVRLWRNTNSLLWVKDSRSDLLVVTLYHIDLHSGAGADGSSYALLFIRSTGTPATPPGSGIAFTQGAISTVPPGYSLSPPTGTAPLYAFIVGHNGTNDTISVRLPAIAFGSGGGGTGLTTVATSGQFTGDGTVADPIFIDAVSAHLITSGTLNTGRLPVVPIDKGGTGATNGTTALSNLGAGTAAERDVGAVSGNLAALDAGGRIPTARLASGTADNTRFLRGDQTWGVPAGGGGGSGTPSDAQPANVTGTSAAGTDSDYSRGDHAHTVDLDTTMAFTSGVLGVNVHDVIEHLSEHIRYFTTSSSFPNAEATVGQAYNTSDFQKNISHIKATFLVPSGGANYVARILRVSGGNQVLEVLGTSAQITPHGEVEGRTFRFTDSGNDVGVALAPNVRIAIVISRLGSGGSAASLAINGSQASASPDKTYDDADMDFMLANDVVYQHENPGVGTNTHTHGSDIRANIGIYYNLSYNHGSLVGGTIVTANPTGTDGDDLTRIAIDGTNYVIPAGGGTAFDIHDDVAVQSTVADADRFVFSDEGSAGDPMKYVTATNLATYMEQEVSLDAARITSGAFSTVRIANNAITTAKIAAEAITHTKMGADSVDGDNVANNTLGPANFHADNSAGFDNIWAIEGPADMASGHWFSPADFRVHIGADQGSAFDIHGDVLTAATITDADHLVFSDESVTGEPMRYTSAGNLAIYLNGVIQLTASQITSGAFLTARIPDLSATKITTGTFHQQRVPGLPASRISSGMLGRDRLGAGIDILGDVTKYLRGDSTWAVPPSTFDIHDGVTTLATPANSDRLVFSDENVTGDPMRYATIGHLVSHVATNVFLNTSRITAGILDTDRMGSGTATSTTYLRGDSTWAIPAGGADFDLHDDVTNSATVVDADRFVFSDESTAGDPMRYTTAANFADYLQQEVSLNADRLTSGVISTARQGERHGRASTTFLRGDRTWSAAPAAAR